MSKFWAIIQRCQKSRQLRLSLGLVCSFSVCAQARNLSRAPANFTPDDDVIVAPVSAEMSFYDKYVVNDKSWKEKSVVKRQISIWQENINMAQHYGLDINSPGAYYVPQSKDKWAYVQSSYFRFLRKQGEDPLKKESNDIWQNWTASKEVDSIDEMESAFKKSNELARKQGIAVKGFEEKNLSKNGQFKFQFQPRLEQGMMIIKLKSPWVEGRAWVSYRGTELKLEKTLESTSTRFLINYYTQYNRYLASVDQPITATVSARATSTWDPRLGQGLSNDQTLQLRYNAEF